MKRGDGPGVWSIVLTLGLALACARAQDAPAPAARRFDALIEALVRAKPGASSDRLYEHAGRLLAAEIAPSQIRPTPGGPARRSLGLDVVAEGALAALHPWFDGPASNAGIVRGDVLMAVDGVTVTNWTVPAIVSRLEAVAEDPVTLSIARDGVSVSVVVARASLFEPAATRWTLEDPKIVAIRWTWLDLRSAARVLAWFPRDDSPIVLDLRGADGDESAAIEVLSALLEPGTELGSWTSDGSAPGPLVSRPSRSRCQSPLIVLQDVGTAGAAAQFARILGRAQRAVLLGADPVEGRGGTVATTRLVPIDGVASLAWPSGSWALPPAFLADAPTPRPLPTDASAVSAAIAAALGRPVTPVSEPFPQPGQSVIAIEKVTWSEFSGGDVLFYRGIVARVEGERVFVTLGERFKLRFRPKAEEGVDSTSWWPDRPKRHSYGPVGFGDWGGTFRSGLVVPFLRSDVEDGSKSILEIVDPRLASARG